MSGSSGSLWLAQNPSKRWGELFFLLYTPFWLTLSLGIVVPYKLYECYIIADIHGAGLEYLLLAFVSALPAFLIPMLLVRKVDRSLCWKDPMWETTFGLIISLIKVLGASYTFPSWKMNNLNTGMFFFVYQVPHTTFFMTHACFLFYHVASNFTLRRLRHSIACLPDYLRWCFEAAWILALSYFIAYLETIAIANFPYYEFVDRSAMYKVGCLFYAIYFIVSFPMFFRMEETPSDEWVLSRVAVDALGAAMLVTIILDLWRLFLGPIVPLQEGQSCLQSGLPWFSH
ncbi:hypothetical protein Bca52824_024058 [Brassica carinata]|uniref:Cycloeucalenol cycloisomerase n=1 Tax=Brassica carinata TaxID=52824 RepID=A0A8X7VJQ4_BRACI|nr:hypothetical protein Bca52824_024058 [Brassica carinata]